MADTAASGTMREEVSPTPQAIPRMVEERIRRGRERMRKKAAQRQLFYKFWRGETYSSVNGRRLLVSQDTVGWSSGGKMPDHRIRNSYPFIASIVRRRCLPPPSGFRAMRSFLPRPSPTTPRPPTWRRRWRCMAMTSGGCGGRR